MIAKVTEDDYAEQPTLAWLEELGWTLESGPVISPSGTSPERDYFPDVVLLGRLRDAIGRLNPDLTADAVQTVAELVTTTTSPVVIDDHAGLHRFLIEGVPVTFEDRHGVERTVRARLVDLEVGNNNFLAVNQFRIQAGLRIRRPDVLLFVNGMPLGEIELKNPADEAATAEGAVNQINDYVDAIPALYRYVEIVAVSDLHVALAGTISTPAEHFAPWRSMDPNDDTGRSKLEVMLRGMFAPERFLDLVMNFVAFQTDGARTWKVLAKYHQVDAVNRAIEATRNAMASDRRAGVVWHTQGSGKSLTMVFYVQKLRQHPVFENPTVVALTDRTDLDQQLHQTFLQVPLLAPAVRWAEHVDGGPDSVRALLRVPAGGVVFTTIQKFARSKDEREAGEKMPVLSDRRNIIVMADEAHRSQYGGSQYEEGFADNLSRALPNAVRIGFTGTPIERTDRSTRVTFGDYVSVYRMSQAVEDGATVPIYYESRVIAVRVEDPELLKQVEDVLEGEEETARTKLIGKWAQLEKVVGAPERLDQLADDVERHYKARMEALAGKALVVGMSRRICAQLADRLKQRLGDEAVTCVMSVSATDDAEIHGPGGEYRRGKSELAEVARSFKDVDSALRVVVVRDMWLTGFDVPSLHTIYVDKPMRDHGLLQAIARVNRVFRDKPGGLVVDYIGVGDDLRSSLAAYEPEVAEEAMIPLEDAIKKLREKHSVVESFFHGLDFRRRHQMSPTERATVLAQAHDTVVADDDTAKRFLTEQGAFARWFALVRPHEPALEMQDDAAFFAAISQSVRKYSVAAGVPSPAAEQAVKQFFSEGLAAGEIVDIFGVAGEDRPEISILSDQFLDEVARGAGQPNLKVQLLRKLLNDEIKVRGRRNAMQAKIFSDQVDQVLSRYANRQLSSLEVIEELVRLAKELRQARSQHEKLGLSEEEAAFYDALAGGVEDISADPQIAEIARKLVASIRADLSVDWSSRESAQAAIRRRIKRILRSTHYRVPAPKGNGGGTGHQMSLDEVTSLLMRQAKVLYAAWPDA
jgi:type I restriction enzyme R subunit